MKTRIAFLLVLLSITSIAQNLDGNWKGVMTTPNGDMNLIFVFKVDAEKLNGSVTSEMGTLPLENGKVNGNEFSFDITVNGQTINNMGILNGDSIKLSSPTMNNSLGLSRVKEENKIDGKWLGKAVSPQGEMELTFTFKVDGDKLTGTNSSAMGEINLSNGVVNGNDFSFDVDVQGMTITHKCKYNSDDSIDVKALVMEQEMDMKLTRVAE